LNCYFYVNSADGLTAEFTPAGQTIDRGVVRKGNSGAHVAAISDRGYRGKESPLIMEGFFVDNQRVDH
jgi:hypothetical protein